MRNRVLWLFKRLVFLSLLALGGSKLYHLFRFIFG